MGAHAYHPEKFLYRGHIVPAMKSTRSSSETNSNTYQWKKTFIYYCVFMIPISIIIYLKNLLAFCSGSSAPSISIAWMSIAFENYNDIIVYPLERLFPMLGITVKSFLLSTSGGLQWLLGCSKDWLCIWMTYVQERLLPIQHLKNLVATVKYIRIGYLRLKVQTSVVVHLNWKY